jgi:ABC-type phosphate transport system substrate-binding protein
MQIRKAVSFVWLLPVAACLIVLVTWGWARAQSKPGVRKPAIQKKGGPDIKTGVAFTPISIISNPPAVDETTTDATLITDVERIEISYREQPNGKVRIESYVYKPGPSTTTYTFRVKVFRAQLNGNNIVGVPSQDARDSWRWVDAAGTAHTWPMDGAPLTVTGTGNKSLKIRYAGGTGGKKSNFIFRVYNASDNRVDDFWAITGVRIK